MNLTLFKRKLETSFKTNCTNCELRYAHKVPYGGRYTIYENAEVILLGGKQLPASKITHVINVCESVYGEGSTSFWPSHVCQKAGARYGGDISGQEACSSLTKKLLKRPNWEHEVIIAFETSLFTSEADIVIKDNLFTENDYATLRFKLEHHKLNGYRFIPSPTNDQYRVLTSTYDDGGDIFQQWINSGAQIALDTETNTLYPYAKGASITLIQLTGPAVENQDKSTVWNNTATLICDLTIAPITNYPTLISLLETNEFILHNATFDVNFIHKVLGVEVKVFADTMLMGHLCKEVKPHALTKYYSDKVLGWGNYDSELRKEITRLKQKARSDGTLVKAAHKNNPIVETPNYSDIPRQTLYDYSALDTQAVWALYPTLNHIIKKDKLTKMNETYKTMRQGLALVQRQGVFIDRPRLEWLDQQVNQQLNLIQADYDINLASNKQVATFIFDELGLPERKSHKWDPRSVKEIALAHLLDNHHVKQILKARTLNKMRGTYTQGFLASLYPDDTIRPSYNITSAKTGRISASNPPLQTIPRPYGSVVNGLDIGAVVRSCVCRPFIGENPFHKNWLVDGDNDWLTKHQGTIVAGDLSQAELRILAALSGAQFFTKAYQEGRDLHSEVASQIFGHVFTKKERSIAKGLNFGFAYGGNLEVLAILAGATPEIAKIVAKKFKILTEDYSDWMRSVVDEIMKHGQLQSRMGRIRRWYNPKNRYDLLKKGPNYLIQSLSSDITNLAAARLALRGFKVFLLWHDGIYIYAERGEEGKAAKALTDTLLGTFREYVTEVPVKMDLDISPRIYMFGKQT